MKFILLIATCFLIYSNIYSQDRYIYIEPAIFFNKRIILDSPAKRKLVNSYEIPTTSGGLNVYIENKLKSLGFGIGFQKVRYGSKKYTWPDSIPNVTPQDNRVKDFIVTNQFNAHFIYNFKYFNPRNNLFIKCFILYNMKSNYLRYSYQSNGRKGLTTVGTDDGIRLHKWDSSISLGYSHLQKVKRIGNTKVSLFTNIYLVPYRTGKSYYSYLPIMTDTNGILWSFGASWAFKIF